jgi:chromosome partitioning protein
VLHAGPAFYTHPSMAPSTPTSVPPGFVRTIALINQKGGVGKTTTSVNLAAGLARLGRPTLLVDLDPQAHATLHLGADQTVGPTVYDLVSDPDSVDVAALLRPARDNLWVIAAETDLAAAESELVAAPDRLGRLKRGLDRAAAHLAAAGQLGGPLQFVLIDCPPSLGLLTLNALAAAREVFIPMQAHFLALQGVSKLLETVGAVGRSVNPRLHVTGVVLCMHDTASTHVKEVVNDLSAFFEGSRAQDVPWKAARVYKPAVRRNIKLAECPSFGQSIFDYAPACPGAADYEQLASALAREWDQLAARASAPHSAAPAPVVVTAAQPHPAAIGPAA